MAGQCEKPTLSVRLVIRGLLTRPFDAGTSRVVTWPSIQIPQNHLSRYGLKSPGISGEGAGRLSPPWKRVAQGFDALLEFVLPLGLPAVSLPSSTSVVCPCRHRP